MNLSESFNELVEQLKKPFYSEREAMLDSFKNSSQISKEEDLETTHILYDPFASYTSSHVFQKTADSAKFNELVKSWRSVSQLPEVDEAIQEIVSEAIVFDEEQQVVDVNLDNIEMSENIKNKIKDSFQKILFLLDFNEKGEELFKKWYIDSILNFEVVYNNRKMKDGLQKLILLPPYNIFKFKNEKTGEIKWFINNKATYNLAKDLDDAEKTFFDEQIVQISSGIRSPDNSVNYSYLQKAMKSINQLYLLEDSLIIYRITRSNEKRLFKVDTGNLPKSKAEEYVRGLINKYRQKRIYNTETGTVEDRQKSISILEDFWFPVNSQGKSTTVEILQGSANNFGNFDDVNYFIEKVYKSLGVPGNRRNKEARITVNSNLDIEREEMKFYKFILKLRRRFNNLFVDLLKKDIISRQIMSLEDWNKIQEKIQFKYADSNNISLIKSMQIKQIKMDAANAALSLIDQGVISKGFIQREILGLTNEQIEEINQESTQSGMTQGADALGNVAGGEVPQGQETPGYDEIGGGKEDTTGSTPEEEKPAKRFQRKVKDSQIPQEVLEQLKDGDIITDGKKKLLFKEGKFKEI